MTDGLSMIDFMQHMNTMSKLHPNAFIKGIGYGCRDNTSFFVFNLLDQGKVISYEIPMFSYFNTLAGGKL